MCWNSGASPHSQRSHFLKKQDLKPSPFSPADSRAVLLHRRKAAELCGWTLPVAGNVSRYCQTAALLGACGVDKWHESQRTFIIAADVSRTLVSNKFTGRMLLTWMCSCRRVGYSASGTVQSGASTCRPRWSIKSSPFPRKWAELGLGGMTHGIPSTKWTDASYGV